MSGLKAIMPTAMVTATIVPTSPHWVRSKERRLPAAHRTTKGATTSAPAKSPSHQVTHATAVGASPEKIRLPMPTVALIIVLETQTNANLATPVVVVNVSRPSHQRLISHAAT